MKKEYILPLILASAMMMADAVSAQNTFLPILEIGKEWTYTNYAVSGELHGPAEFWTWEAVDVTEDDGHKIFTLRLNSDESDLDYVFTKNEYEEEGIWWSFSNEECIYQPMIDFNMEVGDFVGYQEIIWKGPVMIEGVDRNVIALKNSWDGKILYWIEGIGAIDDIYLSPVIMTIGERTRMTECRMGDKCLFNYDRMDEYMAGIDLSGVKSMTSQQNTDDTICDILGRRISAPAPGQLYIKDGRKHIAK